MTLSTLIKIEVLKLRRAWFAWGTGAVLIVMPLFIALFMFMLKNPEMAKQMGLLGQKGSIRGGAADWPTLFSFYHQMLAVGGMLVLGLLVSWVFAREEAEKNAKNLWATGVSKPGIVAAKLIVSTCLFFSAALASGFVAYSVGLWLDLGPVSHDLLVAFFKTTTLLFVLLAALAPAYGYVALRGKGYLVPLSFSIATIIVATIFGMTGWGVWFPWTVVALVAGSGGPDTAVPGLLHFAIFPLVSVLGFIGSIRYLRRADCSS